MGALEQFLKKPKSPEEEKAVRSMINMLCDMMKDDESVPDALRIGLRLIDQANDAHRKIDQMMKLYHDPHEPGGMDHEARYGVRRELEEYLKLMIAGMESFIQTHPVPEVK